MSRRSSTWRCTLLLFYTPRYNVWLVVSVTQPLNVCPETSWRCERGARLHVAVGSVTGNLYTCFTHKAGPTHAGTCSQRTMLCIVVGAPGPSPGITQRLSEAARHTHNARGAAYHLSLTRKVSVRALQPVYMERHVGMRVPHQGSRPEILDS